MTLLFLSQLFKRPLTKRLKKKPSKLQPLRQKWAKSLPRAVQLPAVLMVALSKAKPVGR
jgi:hypothetical protein